MRNSGLSAILVPVLFSLFCERGHKKEGGVEQKRERGEWRETHIVSERLGVRQFSEAAEKSEYLPAFFGGVGLDGQDRVG